MALSELQIANVRRYAGYALAGTPALDENNDIVYMVFGMRQMSLIHRLSNLSRSEESILVDYIDQIETLEAAILTSSDNLDTDKAAVWNHNKREVSDRAGLFNQWRRRMCDFLGLAYGPGLSGAGSMRISRA